MPVTPNDRSVNHTTLIEPLSSHSPINFYDEDEDSENAIEKNPNTEELQTLSKESSPANIGADIQNASVVLSGGEVIRKGLDSIPEIPGTPISGKKTHISILKDGTLAILSVIGSAICIQETWESIKDLYYAENKNLEKLTTMSLNIFRTTALVLLWVGIAKGIALAGPILVPVSAGLAAGWALYQGGKKLYQAYKANKLHDKKTRNEKLKEAAPHLISAVTNSLTVGISASLAKVGSVLTKAHDMFAEGLKNVNFKEMASALSLTQAGGRMFESVKPIGYALSSILTLGTASVLTERAVKHFDETVHAITHPIESAKKFANSVVNKVKATGEFVKASYGLGIPLVPVIAVLEVGSAVVSAAGRLLQLAVAAPIKLASKVFSGIKSFFSKKKPEIIKPEVSFQVGSSDPIIRAALIEAETKKVAEKAKLAAMQAASKAECTKIEVETQLRTQYEQVKQIAKVQVENLAEKTDAKNQAKSYAAKALLANLGESFEKYHPRKNVSLIEAESKAISPYLNQSFFKEVSTTAKLLAKAKTLEAGFSKLKIN